MDRIATVVLFLKEFIIFDNYKYKSDYYKNLHNIIMFKKVLGVACAFIGTSAISFH